MAIDLNQRWLKGHLVLGNLRKGQSYPLIPDTEEDAGSYALVSVSDTVILKAYEAYPRLPDGPVWDPRAPWDPCLYLLGGEPVDALSLPQVLKLLDVSEAALKKAMRKPTIDSLAQLIRKKKRK